MPDVFNGQIYEQIGKYARGAVLFAFEEMGGPRALGEWAKDNQSDFYTKLFPKIIARETEVHHHRSVDELMDALDGDYTEIEDAVPVDRPPVSFTTQTFEDDPADAATLPVTDYTFDMDIDDLVEFEE